MTTKHQKPYPEFPLTPHPRGYWVKKCRGKQYNFGPIEDWKAAYEEYERIWPDILDGRTPKPKAGEGDTTVLYLCNHYYGHQKQRHQDGEIVARTLNDTEHTCKLLLDGLGKHLVVDQLHPDDFRRLRKHIAKGRNIATLKRLMGWCKTVLRYAADERLIDRPVFYGRGFDAPSSKAVDRSNIGKIKTYTATEIHALLDAANPTMHCMILLGINCGFGNTDIARLTLTQAIGLLDDPFLTYRRPKTGHYRRSYLWPETIAAISDHIDHRKSYVLPNCFVTKFGNPYVGDRDDAIACAFTRLCKRADVPCRGFYSLRHTFRTISDRAKDTSACNVLMGHKQPGRAHDYLHSIEDHRLQAAVDHVHSWLWEDRTNV